MYLGTSGLSCTMQDFHCVMWDLLLGCTDSLDVASGLSCPVAYGILVPWPGIEPASPCIARQILNHWTTREVFPPPYLILMQSPYTLVLALHIFFLQELMTVFQLLHWNGSLKAMRERQCSRQVRVPVDEGSLAEGVFWGGCCVINKQVYQVVVKSFLMKVKEESEKSWLKAQHSEK